MVQWPPIVKPIQGRPTEVRLKTWRRDQIWKALNACKEMEFREEIRNWLNEVDPDHFEEPEYRSVVSSAAVNWPGWDGILGTMPSLEDCVSAWEKGEDLPLPTEGPRAPLPPVYKPGQVWPALRFRVLERDAFTCQYCGRKAPDVALEVDHVVPRSKNGPASMDNLVTACWECNIGKGGRPLTALPLVVGCRPPHGDAKGE